METNIGTRFGRFPFNRSSSIRLKALISTVAIFIASAASPAFADDRKTYPGNLCQPGPFATASTISYGLDGSVENTASGSIYVVCPVVRDNTTNTTGLKQIQVQINKPSSTGTYCSFYSKSADGVNTFFNEKWNFEGSGNRIISLNVQKSYASGYYFIACILPPKAKVVSYIVNEAD
ncbi:MAG: hypothetical protein ICV63_09515 [Coleofasciculus sp. Co-bin14]|nr:hypothetical protein [Coleofasciculus sp. Co-bin14]